MRFPEAGKVAGSAGPRVTADSAATRAGTPQFSRPALQSGNKFSPEKAIIPKLTPSYSSWVDGTQLARTSE